MQTSSSHNDISEVQAQAAPLGCGVNQYALSGRCETTGWNPSIDHVNGVNELGMRPIEVAAQAGDAREFAAIMTHPDYDPTAARPRMFLEIGRSAWEYFYPDRLVRMRGALLVHFATFGRV